jgi:hypothetical protein
MRRLTMESPLARVITTVVAATLVASLAPVVHAQGTEESRLLSDRFNIKLGGFLVDLRTDAQIGIEGVIGSFLRLEEVLNLDSDQTVARFDGFYRFAPKHALEFGFLSINRTGFGELEKDIDYLGLRFTGDFESEFDMDLYRVVYKYSFANNGRINAGFSAGLSVFEFSMALQGEAEIIDPVDPDFGLRFERERADRSVSAPVPAFGMFIDYAIKPRLILQMSAEFFDLEIAEINGRYIDTQVVLDYYFSEHVGVGGGLNTTDLSYINTGDRVRVEYRYSGILAYLSLVF